MAEADVRVAIAGDGLAIAWIQLEVWQTAFADRLPDELLLMAPADLARAWNATVDAPDQVVLVALEGTQLVGFAQVALADSNSAIGEVRVLYVRPAWARRGHGGRLIAVAASTLRARGATIGEWWIPDSDTASQRFVGSLGWAATGEARTFDTGKGFLAEQRWTGSLDLELGTAP